MNLRLALELTKHMKLCNLCKATDNKIVGYLDSPRLSCKNLKEDIKNVKDHQKLSDSLKHIPASLVKLMH